MTVRLYGCVYGHLHSPASCMGLPSEALAAFPAPFCVIDHPGGIAVYDCGLCRGMMEEGDR